MSILSHRTRRSYQAELRLAAAGVAWLAALERRASCAAAVSVASELLVRAAPMTVNANRSTRILDGRRSDAAARH